MKLGGPSETVMAGMPSNELCVGEAEPPVLQDVAGNSGAKFRAATVRERSAASTRGAQPRPRFPSSLRLVPVRTSPAPKRLFGWLLVAAASSALWLGSAVLQAASDSLPGDYPSGTYQGRNLTELFRHKQAESRRRAQGIALSASRAALRQDNGEIAILDDSAGVVLRPNAFDLNESSLTFTRVGDAYTAEPAVLGFDPDIEPQAIPLVLSDDDAERVALPFAFPFFDKTYSEVFVHSDGNVTFEEPEASSTSRSFARMAAGPPRIAPLFTDLDPSLPQAAVTAHLAANRVVVTWRDVPEFRFAGTGRRQTFQLALHQDGRIEFHYASINLTDIVVGLVPGRLQGDTAAADLSDGLAEPAPGGLAEIFTRGTAIDTVAVTQQFYRNHGDAYDFLVLFNNMGLQSGPGSFAFELNIRNDVDGIGSPQPDANPIFDFGSAFGSPVRLQSYLNMGPLANYPDDPAARIPILGHNTTLSVLGQEAGHRFLVYLRFLDLATGRPSSALLGRQNAHWSFFFHSDASVGEGNRIVDKGMVSPRFETTAAVEKYGELDQYVMGLRSADEVQPSFLVENPSTPRSASSPPAVGVTFDGTRKEITVDMIIAAEGERSPDVSVSQKDWTFAFILLVPEGSDPPAADIEKIDRIRTEWQEFFSQAVDQRGSARTNLVNLLHLSTWPAAGVLQGFPAPATVRIDSPLESSLEVLLTSDSPVISVPPVVTMAAGFLEESFVITGNSLGTAELTARVGLPGYDEARTIIQVSNQATDLSLEIESGDNQSAGDGSPLPQPVVFRLRDRNKLHYSGIPLVVSASGDGIAAPARAVTDSTGRVRVEWRLATAGPLNSLRAEIQGTPAVGSTATAISAGPQPLFSGAGVVNAASFNQGTSSGEPVLTPGGLYSIFGTSLSAGTDSASSPPLPRQLAGTTVSINGTPVPLLHASPLQINFQAPFELNGSAAEVVVTSVAGSSVTVELPITETQPGIFFNAQTGVGAILNADGTPVTQTPPEPGDFVQIFVTGLGAVEPAGRTGIAASVSPLSVTTVSPQVLIGGRQASVVFSGLAPFFTGLYQINAQVPMGLPPGSHTLSVDAGGIRSNEVFLEVQ